MRISPSAFVRYSKFAATKLAPLGFACALLAGCANYGSFDENEPSLEESLIGEGVSIIGGERREEPIDYSARAPLVAPPDAASLPAPATQQAGVSNPNWPTGSQARMQQVLTSENQTLVYTPGVDGVDIAATQALAAQSGQRQTESNSGIGRPLTVAEMQREAEIHAARAQANAARDQEATVQGRRFLTDPPVAARTPSPEAPSGEAAIALAEEEEENSGGWWPF